VYYFKALFSNLPAGKREKYEKPKHNLLHEHEAEAEVWLVL
jgi:hypothetical protein